MQPTPTFTNRILAILGAIAFVGLAIASLFIFSYLLIFIAIIGLVLFVVSYIRLKLFGKQIQQRQRPTPNQPSGRIIDHDDND